MYTSPDQAPRSFGEAPRQPLTGPMTDQDPTSTATPTSTASPTTGCTC